MEVEGIGDQHNIVSQRNSIDKAEVHASLKKFANRIPRVNPKCWRPSCNGLPARGLDSMGDCSNISFVLVGQIFRLQKYRYHLASFLPRIIKRQGSGLQGKDLLAILRLKLKVENGSDARPLNP